MMLLARGARRAHAEAPRRVQARTKRDELIAEFRENNHAIEAIESMESRSARAANRTRSSSRTTWSPTVDDPELGHTTQVGVPIHLSGTPGAIQGPQPAARPAQRRDLRRARLLRTPRSRPFSGSELMHALEGVRLIDFGQYLAGPFGPMVIGDLGADVIKVEPVTGDGMRDRGQAVLRLPAREARHRARPQEPNGAARSRCELVRERRHRAPQHDGGRREAARHRLRRLQARERPTSCTATRGRTASKEPLARFGGLDPLYQASAGLEYEPGAGARRQRAALLPLRDVRRGRTRCSRSSACLAALYHQRAHRRRPGAVDVAARRRRDVRVRRVARRRRGGAAAPARQGA